MGFILGLFIGATIGIVGAAICATASQGDT